MKQILIDTNVVVSAFLWGGAPRRVIDGAIESGILLLTTDEILTEIERTLSKKKLSDQLHLVGKSEARIVLEYSLLTTLVSPSSIEEEVVRDSKDKMILEAATGGRADAVVTGDKDLLTLKEYNGISIVTPSQFLSVLSSSTGESTDKPQPE